MNCARRGFALATVAAAAGVCAGLASRASAAEDDAPPIVRAAARGDLPAVEALLAKGADPNAARADGSTALMAAAQLGRHDIARTLLARGAARDQRDRAGRSAFDFAVERRHGDLIALLRDAS